MYVKVDSLALLNQFNHIWMQCWIEKGYGLENENKDADRFLIVDDAERKIGTIEFKPYSLHPSNDINTVFPFYQLHMMNKDPQSVVEIDKTAILKEYRGANLARLLSLFVHYSEYYHVNYCVALLERNFYKALQIVYKIPMEQAGEKVYYKGDYVTPTIIFPQKIIRNKENYPWLLAQKSDKKINISS